jgi:K(+)-stimulated pyrophosphate-energized sodium pump
MPRQVERKINHSDPVGDPLKDTSGPSLNILIKLSAILSLVFVPFFVQYGGILLKFM